MPVRLMRSLQRSRSRAISAANASMRVGRDDGASREGVGLRTVSWWPALDYSSTSRSRTVKYSDETITIRDGNRPNAQA
jgi:hypothetical protein